MKRFHGIGVLLIIGLSLASWQQTAHAMPHRALTSPTFLLGPTPTGYTQPTAVPEQVASFETQVNYASVGWPESPNSVSEYLVKVDHVSSPTACAAATVKYLLYRVPTSSNSQTDNYFSLGFNWPDGATSVAGGTTSPYYAICLHMDDAPGVPDVMSSADTTSNEVYTVIGDVAPSVTISSSTIVYGQSITVTGKGWKYYHDDPQGGPTGVNFQVGSYTASYAFAPAHPDANGDFTVVMPINQGESPGKYFLSVDNNLFHHYDMLYGTAFRITLLAHAPTPTPPPSGQGNGATPTATATTSATTTAQPTASPTTSAANADAAPPRPPSASASTGFPWWLTICLVLVMVAGGGATLLLLARRKGSAA